MRVLVCGSRHFKDADLMSQHLTELYMRNPVTGLSHPIVEGLVDFSIIEGEAPGADSLARDWAEARCLPVHKFPANWSLYGKRAGPIRNHQMLVEGKPDYVIAFMFKDSRGTKNMVEQAEKVGVKVKIIHCE